MYPNNNFSAAAAPKNLQNNNFQINNSSMMDDSKSMNFDPNVTPMLLEYIQKGDKIHEHPLVVKNDFIVFGRYGLGFFSVYFSKIHVFKCVYFKNTRLQVCT